MPKEHFGKDVKIRGLDLWVFAFYQQQAENDGISVEEKLRRCLIESALQAQRNFAQTAHAIRQAIFEKQGLLPNSTLSIREEREARG